MPHSTVEMASQDDAVMSDAPSHQSASEQDSHVKVEADEADPKPDPAAPKADVKLEHLFDDVIDGDDDDEDFLASAVDEESKSDPETLPSAPAAKYSDEEVMKSFYQRLFPFQYLFQWLNHSPSPTTDFGHREFAFTLQNGAYLRYQAFPTAHLLRKEILRLNPSRFEIGPVYTANPRDRKTLRKSTNFRPLAKELVFDIDLTDYDEIRTCCSGTSICHKCWAFITMAVKVVDAALRDDFAFEHILWVYSGRRGAHAWICDKRARQMDDQKRKAIAGYLEVIKGGKQSGKKVNLKRPLHPHLSLDILKDHFQEDILTEQNPWLEEERAERLLELLPDKALNESLRKKWQSAPHRASKSKWADIDSLAKAGASRSLDAKALLECKQDVVLEYSYPRLDVEVSKKLIHLLKSPFVVHPGTGRVCVPIDVGRLADFDFETVPTVTQLLGEIDAWDRQRGAGEEREGETKRLQDYEKTSLKPYVDYFRRFVADLLKDEDGVKEEAAVSDPMEF